MFIMAPCWAQIFWQPDPYHCKISFLSDTDSEDKCDQPQMRSKVL